MKLFFYKSVLIFFLFLAAFHFSIGYTMKKIKVDLISAISKDNVENIKIKIRKEMQSAINKNNYINPDDALLINKFINKIKSDLEK